MEDANSLSSTAQTVKPSTLLQETNSGESNHQTSTDSESPLNDTQAQSNSEIVSDIGGLTLSLLILQKQQEKALMSELLVKR